MLLNSASFYDLTSENSYHMLLVGLLFGVPGYGNPASNREAGRGRFDIRLAPERAGLPAVTLELKFEHGADASRLQVLATEALAQIEGAAYDADTARGGAALRLRRAACATASPSPENLWLWSSTAGLHRPRRFGVLAVPFGCRLRPLIFVQMHT